MAFWNLSKPPRRRTYRQQIAAYELEGKPFAKSLLLCALSNLEEAELVDCTWKDLDSALLNSASIVVTHITFTAMKANGLALLLTRGVVIRQPKIRAIVAFNAFVMLCVSSHLKVEGSPIDIFELAARTVRLLCVGLINDEWDRVCEDIFQLNSETCRELFGSDSPKSDAPGLKTWKEAMNRFVPGYVLWCDKSSPQAQSLNLPYPWLFEQQLAVLLRAEEGSA